MPAGAGGDARPESKKRPSERLPDYAQLVEIGKDFLSRIYCLHGDNVPSSIEGALLDRGDRIWLKKRQKKLASMAEGRIRCIPKAVWNIATLCMHPVHGIETIKRYAARVPSEFLAVGCAVALLQYGGGTRAVDSRRAQSILTLTIVMWLLAKRSKEGGHWGYVIQGLPYGAFCWLVARFENYGRAERRPPHVNTVWGTHRAGGRFDRSEVGYVAAMRQAGMIRTKQPPWYVVETGRRGLPRTNGKGELECWAFVEVFLRIPPPGADPAELGPLPLTVPRPPPPLPRPRDPSPSVPEPLAAATDPGTALQQAFPKKPAVSEPAPEPAPRPVVGPTHEGLSLRDYLSLSGDGNAFLTQFMGKRGPPSTGSSR